VLNGIGEGCLLFCLLYLLFCLWFVVVQNGECSWRRLLVVVFVRFVVRFVVCCGEELSLWFIVAKKLANCCCVC